MYGKFVCEPLERGYGTTIGNALRRVLLASLQGAAFVAVKISGVQHEFTTIPGVLEDVTDIILNIKQGAPGYGHRRASDRRSRRPPEGRGDRGRYSGQASTWKCSTLNCTSPR